MHRTQLLLEEHQYRRLKQESARSGRSIGDLVREAIDARFGTASRGALREAIEASSGAWASLEVDGRGYVERVRQGLGGRLAELGWA